MKFSTMLLTGLAAALSLMPLAADEPAVKKSTARNIQSVDGRTLFFEYCGVCHGRDGRGGGPAAESLKKRPADLTQIARKNGGKYPEMAVRKTIEGDSEIGAHGSKEMPVWGSSFRAVSGNADMTILRISNLAKYLESIQAK